MNYEQRLSLVVVFSAGGNVMLLDNEKVKKKVTMGCSICLAHQVRQVNTANSTSCTSIDFDEMTCQDRKREEARRKNRINLIFIELVS